MKKRILFIAPKYMNLYQDIIAEMERQNYEVDFIAEQGYKEDPDNVRGYVKFSKALVNEKKFTKKMEKRWIGILESDRYNKTYDYCFVLDGQSISPVLFKMLRTENPNIKIVNYLFDTTTGVYHFEKNFKFYDKVFSFDISESKKYNIEFLPIYWMPCDEKIARFDLFGFGAIKDDRFELFSRLEQIAKKNSMQYFLKLYNFVNVKSMLLYRIRCLVYRCLGLKNVVSARAINSSFATKDTISPKEFRCRISESKVVVDTASPYQDGLTARFMWSLGLGKKIITTNANVKNYDFFDKKQVFVYTNTVTDEQIESFLTPEFEMTDAEKEHVAQYRLDQWLKKILD